MPHAKALYKILCDFAVGFLISVFFYLLVVHLPDYQRRQRLKRSFERHYKVFREDCIQIMLLVIDDPRGAPETEMLMEQHQFGNYFKEKGDEGLCLCFR